MYYIHEAYTQGSHCYSMHYEYEYGILVHRRVDRKPQAGSIAFYWLLVRRL